MSQPQACGRPPPSSSVFQERSSSAWSSQSTTMETASLNAWWGPALIAWKRCPRSVKSTTFTDPGGPLGVSLWSSVT
ncbi:hypothetical protein QHF89_24290 [Polyangium sorediatum]|uniref:Uncharacterized protein n=1 Tax=Polyangium sorediatum TaxID=889274 RepID=A0ABT6NWD5_9BACT|nr:hypothetical protein [Polyangium sorediatum]MDI1432638.1 hypothetical protein [Polyangium sorediatum]